MAVKTKELEVFKDYIFKDWNGGKVTLSSIFGGKEDLILIHNMGRSCPMCTMWADGFNGVVHHLEDRAAFAVISPDPPAAQKKFAQGRGWKFRMYSAHRTSFNREMGFETKDGDPEPGVSVFRKGDKGKVFRVAKSRFGTGDKFCIVWPLFDLLPGGSEGWSPKFKY